MERVPVASSIIRSVGYDSATAVLELEFEQGAHYRYFLVPQSVYRGLLEAGSKGRFFGDSIRDRYRFEKI